MSCTSYKYYYVCTHATLAKKKCIHTLTWGSSENGDALSVGSVLRLLGVFHNFLYGDGALKARKNNLNCYVS